MKIKLENNQGKHWNTFDSGFIKGYAFIGDVLLSEREIYNKIIDALKNEQLDALILSLNGSFSAVILYDNLIYLIADKLKTYPLLYSFSDSEWIVSDQSQVMLNCIKNPTLEDISISSYLATGYLHSNHTFLSECKIVAAGTIVILRNNSATISQYHKHIYDKVELSDEQLMSKCMSTMEGSLKRMLLSIGDRPIWIPLSGGYDSRLLACLCRKLNVKNVNCFTYGIAGSSEVEISKKVATQLGFPWYHVEYTKEKFLAAIRDPKEDEYILFGMNLNTTTHLQDYIAFKELVERGLIKDNAVIVPGHSGEILGRDQVPYNLLDGNYSIAELIFYKYFQWNILKYDCKKAVLNALGVELNQVKSKDNRGLTIDLFTNWNIQNRQANFIVNAVRVYEFFGFEWRVPLWDDELSNFWFSLDYKVNSDVNLYNRFLFNCYFIPMKVDFYKSNSRVFNLLAKVRIPFGIKDKIKGQLTKLKYFKLKYDENGLNCKTNIYLNRMSHSILPDKVQMKKSNANAVLAYYQIDLLRKHLELKD